MKNDEILIQLRDDMTERDILDVLRNVSKIQHRLLQVSITGGAKAHLAFTQVLFQAAGATEMAVLNLEQSSQQKSGLVRPQ
jgi:hypothetical protein